MTHREVNTCIAFNINLTHICKSGFLKIMNKFKMKFKRQNKCISKENHKEND